MIDSEESDASSGVDGEVGDERVVLLSGETADAENE